MIDTPAAARLKQFEDVLAAFLLSLVWLVPNHQLPWTAFHHELLVALALGVMFLLLAGQARQGLRWPVFALVLMALAVVPWLQWAAGMLPKSGTAFISSAYIAGLALAVVLGFSARGTAAERLTGILMLALVLAALLNLPIQLIQWFQLYPDDMTSIASMLITPIARESRPSGSILQPNLLATLQVWALLGLTWLHLERRLNRVVFWLAFVLIVVGLGLTQSRAGMLEMALCTAVLAVVARRWAGTTVCITWGAMLALLVLWSLNFQAVADALGVLGAAEGRLSAVDGARIDAWLAFGKAILDSPWWGYGITDVGYAYFLRADIEPALYIGQRFGHAHNLILDLMLWVGVPLALLLLVSATVWGVRRLRDAVAAPALWIPLLILMTLTLHAMLELPHQYLYMLVPAGICVGIVCAATGAAELFQSSRRVNAAVAAAVFATAGATAWDYFPYQERFNEWRFDNVNIGYRLNIPIKPPLVLDQLHDELAVYRMDLDRPLSPEQLDWMQETAQAVTTAPAIYRTALALTVAGRTDEARVWMVRYNAITPPELVQQTQLIWARDQRKHPELAGVDWPPYQGRLSTFRFEAEPLSAP